MKNEVFVPVNRRPKDPFDGFFRKEPEKGRNTSPLLDFSNAQRWLKSIGWHTQRDYYLYQQALESKSSSEVLLNGQRFIMLSSYDYLGLIGNEKIEAAAIDAVRQYGTGTGGVRLLTGTNELHLELEKTIASFKGTEAALTFTSGYMANIAAVTGLMSSKGLIFLDEYIHRSIIDACELAKTPYVKYKHNNVEHLESLLREAPAHKRRLIITEGVFSMDGDRCPLLEIVEVKKRYGAFLMVDEAHAFGYVGKTGSGTDEYYGIPTDDIDLWTGSLSKTIPSNGGFIAASRETIYYLQHGAAPFFFSAALCPAAAASAQAAIQVISEDPGRIERLWHNTNYLRTAFQELGYHTGDSETPIIPVIMGEDLKTHQIARELFYRGILATSVVFPAVPLKQSRLRICVSAAHDQATLDRIVTVFKDLAPHFIKKEEKKSKGKG